MLVRRDLRRYHRVNYVSKYTIYATADDGMLCEGPVSRFPHFENIATPMPGTTCTAKAVLFACDESMIVRKRGAHPWLRFEVRPYAI